MTDYMKEAGPEEWRDALQKLSGLRSFLEGWRLSESCARNGMKPEVERWIDGVAELFGMLAHIQRGAVPEGWQVVPKEPIKDMVRASVKSREGHAVYTNVGSDGIAYLEECARYDYLAMLAAAPAPDQFRDAAKMMADQEGWSLDESEAALLHHLTSPDDDGEHSPITLRVGNVRMDDEVVKFGLLCEYTDYPDEGATLIVEGQPTVAAPAPAPDHFRDAAEMVAEPAEPDPLHLSRILHELAGAASLCWEPRPAGVFDSQQAIQFVEQALSEIRSRMTPAPAEVPMPEPVVQNHPSGKWSYHADQMRTYGAACRAAGEAAGYARGLKEAGWDAKRYRWLRDKRRTGELDTHGIYIGVDSPRFVGKWAISGEEADSEIDAALRGEVKP